ncbi:hypothetical protein [Streptomyces chrestomyceticus]|uniref:hypothetical protein n=1 Tax=Streptomyces chrestomyceticus TaxID=68185 RepID=UPI0033F1D6AD
MTTRQTTQEPPVVLPGAVDEYLYGYTLPKGCGVCAALDGQFKQAKKKRDSDGMFKAASEIRHHPHKSR